MLDCGHEPSEHTESTTGYGVDSAGKKHCYACCLAQDIESLRTEQHWTAYLASDGKSLTTWPGGHLARITWSAVRKVGFGWKPSRVYWNAIDVHGQRWHGTSPGPGMYARMHRSKGRA